jgi:opacity protein-like surface antigen
MRFGAVYHFGAKPSYKSVPPFDYDGFYVGLQGGFGALISNNAGDRNPPQTLQVKRAGSGATGGLLAGVGITFGPIYVGAEAEAELGNADWNIERDPNGRVYSVTKDYTLGASGRLGYIIHDNTLIYGRAGIADTRFKNRYFDEHGINYVTPNLTKTGLRVGGGVEMPIASGMLVRLDYTWTRYGSYNVDYVTGIDFFRNQENLFRLGLIFDI